MLRQRSISAIGIVLFTAIPAFIGGYVFAAAIVILGILGVREMLGAIASRGYRPFQLLSQVAVGVILFVAAFRTTPVTVVWLVLLLLISTMVAAVLNERTDGVLVDWSLSFTTIVYVAVPLFFAVALRATPGDSTQRWSTSVAHSFDSPAIGLAWLGIAISVTWLNDTAAFLIGRQFGRAKLAPRLSPGKTRVGAIAGVIAGMLTAALTAWLFGAPISVWVALGAGFILSISGQVGDLAESAIKRSLGVKDMGVLIPGHGGVLDRIDALLFTFPVTYMLVQVLIQIGWM